MTSKIGCLTSDTKRLCPFRSVSLTQNTALQSLVLTHLIDILITLRMKASAHSVAVELAPLHPVLNVEV